MKEYKVDITQIDGGAPADMPTQQQRKSATAQALFVTQAVQSGRKIINYGISNYSNLTGDTITQAKISRAVEGVGYLATIGTGFAAGGIVGGIVATVATGVQIGLGEYDRQMNINKANIESARLQQRVRISVEKGGR